MHAHRHFFLSSIDFYCLRISRDDAAELQRMNQSEASDFIEGELVNGLGVSHKPLVTSAVNTWSRENFTNRDVDELSGLKGFSKVEGPNFRVNTYAAGIVIR